MNDITEKTIQEIINEIKNGSSLDNKNIFAIKKYIRKLKLSLLSANKENVNDKIRRIVDKKKIEPICNIVISYDKEINRNINDLFYVCFEYIFNVIWRMKQCEKKEKYMNTLKNNKGVDLIKEMIMKHYQNVNENNKNYCIAIYKGIIDIETEINKDVKYSNHLEIIQHFLEKSKDANSNQFSMILSMCSFIIKNNIPNSEENTKQIELILPLFLDIISNNNNEKSIDNIIKTLSLINDIIIKFPTKKVIKQSNIISSMNNIYILNKEKNDSNQNVLLLLKDLANLIISKDDIAIIISIIKAKSIDQLQLPKIRSDILCEFSKMIELKDNDIFISLKNKILDLFSFFINDNKIINLFQESNAIKTLLLYLQVVQSDNENYNNTTLLNFTLSLISSNKLVGNVSNISDNLLYTMSLICIQMLQDNINTLDENTIKHILGFLKWRYDNTRRAFEQLISNDNKGKSIEILFMNLIKKYGGKEFLFNFFNQIPNGVLFKINQSFDIIQKNPAEEKLESTLGAIEQIILNPDLLTEKVKINFVNNIQSILLQIQLKTNQYSENTNIKNNDIKPFNFKQNPETFKRILTYLIQFLFQNNNQGIQLQDASLVKIVISIVFNIVMNNPFYSYKKNDFYQCILILLEKISFMNDLRLDLFELILDNCVKIITTKNEELITQLFSDYTMIKFVFIHLKRKENYTTSIIKNIIYMLYITLTTGLSEVILKDFIKEKYLFDFIDLVIYSGADDEVMNKHTQTIFSLFYSLYKNSLIKHFCSYQNTTLLYEFISKIKVLFNQKKINNCVFFEIATIIKRCIENELMKQNISASSLFILFYQCGYIDFIIDEINKLSINYIYENSLTVMTCNNYKNNNIETLFSVLTLLLKFDFESSSEASIHRFIYEKIFNAINNIFPEQNLCKDINYINITLFNEIIEFLSSVVDEDSISSLYTIRNFRELIKKIKVYLLYPPNNPSFMEVVLKLLNLFIILISLLTENELIDDRDMITIGFFRTVVLNIPREERKIKESFFTIISMIEKEFMKSSQVTEENLTLNKKFTNPLKPIEVRIAKNPEIGKDIEYIMKELNTYLSLIKEYKKELNSEVEKSNENIFYLIKSLREIFKDKDNADQLFKDDTIDLLTEFLECDPFYCLQYVKNEIILFFISQLTNEQRFNIVKNNKKINHYLISQFKRLKKGSIIETNLKNSEYLCNKYEFITSTLNKFIEDKEYLNEQKKLITSKTLIHIIEISNPNDKILAFLLKMLTQILFYENNHKFIKDNIDSFTNMMISFIYMNYKNSIIAMEDFIRLILILQKEKLIFEKLLQLNIATIINNLLSRENDKFQYCCLLLDSIISMSVNESFVNLFFKENLSSIGNIVKKAEENITSVGIIERCLTILTMVIDRKINLDANSVIKCCISIEKQFLTTNNDNIKILALKIIASLIPDSGKQINIIKASTIDLLMQIHALNTKKGDIIYYILSIGSSIYDIIYNELIKLESTINNNYIEIVMNNPEFNQILINKVIQFFALNERVITELFKYVVSVYKTSRFREFVGQINEQYIEFLILTPNLYYNNESSIKINLCLIQSLLQFFIYDEASFISKLDEIFQYLISFLSNDKNLSKDSFSACLKLLLELSQNDIIIRSLDINKKTDFFILLLIKNKKLLNKENISIVIQVLNAFFENQEVELPNLFLIMILEIINLKEEKEEEELIDTTHKVNEDDEKDYYSINLQNLQKISELFYIEKEIDAKQIATLLTELFQTNVDKIKNSLVPVDSDYQNLCVIFKLISNICINSDVVLQKELNNEANDLSNKINTFLDTYKENGYLEEEKKDDLNENEIKPEKLTESIQNIYTEISTKSKNDNHLYFEILKKEEVEDQPKEKESDNSNALIYLAKSCLLNIDEERNKNQKKKTPTFVAPKQPVHNSLERLHTIKLEEGYHEFLTTRRRVNYYNNKGTKKNALIFMDDSLEEVFVIKNDKEHYKQYAVIKMKDMDSCVRTSTSEVFKKAGGLFSKKPNPNRCFLIRSIQTYNQPQLNINIECDTDKECINYVDYLSAMINNELHKKGK